MDIVPLAAMLVPIVALLIPIFALYFWFKKEQAKTQVRMKAIEKGLEVPPEPVREPLKPLDYLRRGLICLGVGVGLGVGGGLFRVTDQEAGGIFIISGLVVFLIGVALVVYYNFQNKIKE